MRKIEGDLSILWDINMEINGVFFNNGTKAAYSITPTASSDFGTASIGFDSSRINPTTYENRPASISALICISY